VKLFSFFGKQAAWYLSPTPMLGDTFTAVAMLFTAKFGTGTALLIFLPPADTLFGSFGCLTCIAAHDHIPPDLFFRIIISQCPAL